MKKILFAAACLLIFLTNCKKDEGNFSPLIACEIDSLSVTVGNCTSLSTYQVTIDFTYANPVDSIFIVHDRNFSVLGRWTLDQLPITIQNFPKGNSTYDYLKVGMFNQGPDTCQAEAEFLPPDCLDTIDFCLINDLEVIVGDCCADDSDFYELTINFFVQNPSTEFFDLFVRNGVLIGTYRFDQLPIRIAKFPKSGAMYDFIKIRDSGDGDCVIEHEFLSPDCSSTDCSISNFELEVGDCVCEDAYNITIDFDYQNATSDYFDVYVRNGEYLGSYRLDQLPLVIPNFEMSGNRDDYIKIVLNNDLDCSLEYEWTPPDCDPHPTGCEISNLRVDVGDCTSDSTYIIKIDFDVQNAGNDYFDAFDRDGFIGFAEINALPLYFREFKLSGRNYDFLKVCVNDNPDCCKEIEWLAPDCQ